MIDNRPSPATTAKIRALNDAFRTTLDPALGRCMVTRGAAPHQYYLMQHVIAFDRFTQDNDPHHEHDFGAFDYQGTKYFFKIDYYDKACEMGSEDPSNPAVTTRVLTIMRADEY